MYFYCVKLWAQKSGRVNFLTNLMFGQSWAAKTRESSLVSSNGSPEESGIEDGQQQEDQYTTAKFFFLSSLLTSGKHFY